MSFLNTLGSIFDYQALLVLLIRAGVALLCLSVHELCHGLAAWKLGDPTAQRAGRLSLNPLRHIDPLGFILLVVAGFGWAKPVPVNPNYFKKPKQGMAITALAGPCSNFVMSILSAALLSLLYTLGVGATEAGFWVMAALAVMMWLNLGLGVFNLFPIPPLDGSKVLFSFLPDRIYNAILRYERYIMLLLFALVFFGVLDTPLSYLMNLLGNGICTLTGLPVGVLAVLLNYIYA
ncbi:MAG: site-2 protease family protein [Clostridiales bacterium]|nr:site-2 protease family protein [Clostridiales bacterium]